VGRISSLREAQSVWEAHRLPQPTGHRIICLVGATILLSSCLALSPQSPTPHVVRVKVCPDLPCPPSLTVTLSGAVPDDYALETVTPDGQSMSIRCVDGTELHAGDRSKPASYPVCAPHGVEFHGFWPDEATATLSWDENTVSQTLKPNYRLDYRYGPDCPPCRVGEVTFIVPDQ
jgi:hypothetical protein